METFYGRCLHSRTLPTLISGQTAVHQGPSLPFTPSLHSCNGFPPLSLSRCGFQTCHMRAPFDSRTAASLTVPAEMSAHHFLWSLTTAGLNCKKASADSCLHNIHFLNAALSSLRPLDKKLRQLAHTKCSQDAAQVFSGLNAFPRFCVISNPNFMPVCQTRHATADLHGLNPAQGFSPRLSSSALALC